MLDIIGKEIKTLSVNISQRCLVSSLCNLPDTQINNVSFKYYLLQNVFAVADKLYLYHFYEAGLIMLVTLGQYWQS